VADDHISAYDNSDYEHATQLAPAHKASLSLGDRARRSSAQWHGQLGVCICFGLFMAVWAALNTIAAFHHWDKYPFILLNLFLSMLAAVQGAILLIALSGLTRLSAAMAQHDYDTNVGAKKRS